MKRFRVIEILCIVFVAMFIFFSVSSVQGTDRNAKDISAELLPIMKGAGLRERQDELLRKNFSFNMEGIESFAYYTSDDVMNVNELLVLVVTDTQMIDAVTLSVKTYVTDRYELYKDYAPKEGALLENYCLKVQGNAVLFCVHEKCDVVSDEFLESL